MDNLSDDTVLWKYMDISKFIYLISQKSLWLARADTFKDKHEGQFPLEMRQTLEAIYKQFEKDKQTKSSLIKDASDFQLYLIKNAYINCWHQNLNENMVMWEIYGQTENSIAIRTTVKQLRDSLELDEIKKTGLEMAFESVTYQKPEDVKESLKYRTPFFIKRPHFSFEKEVRIFLSTYSSINPSLNTSIGHKIPINFNSMFNGVYVHPDAEDWFLKTVQALVKQFKLSINVKKGLYGNKF